MKFHLDENADGRIADRLRSLHIDVTTTDEVGLKRRPDEEQLAFAHATGRVIITRDDDFARMHALGLPHSGILHYAQSRHGVGDVVEYAQLLHECVDPVDMVGVQAWVPRRSTDV